MENQKSKTETKKAVANEIVNIFKKIKISLLCGLIWFVGISVYNKLFEYSLFDYNFGWSEAQNILGYQPSQYTFVAGENLNSKFGDPTYGSMEISDEGRLEVKKEIISELFEYSIIFTFTMIGVTFIIILLVGYLKKVINWTNKYAD
jgi:hypothetical protein